MASAKLAAKQSTHEVCRESEQVQGNAKRYGRCLRQEERLRATRKTGTTVIFDHDGRSREVST